MCSKGRTVNKGDDNEDCTNCCAIADGKPGDSRVLAHTRLIGGGESDAVTFDSGMLKPDGDYTFFCSFPGHSGVMKGKLSLSK